MVRINSMFNVKDEAHVASQHYTTIMPKIKQLIVGNKDLKIFEYE